MLVLAVFAITLLASLVLTPLVRRFALRLGLVDRPDPRKLHLVPTPLLGGLAMYIAFAAVTILFFQEIRSYDPLAWNQMLGVLGGAGVLLVVGILDDWGGLHSQLKLFLAMPLAGVILFSGGVGITAWPAVADFKTVPELYTLTSLALTVLWVVAVTAAFSILDHMDGLCSGIAAVASAFCLFLALENGQYMVAALSAAMLGACLGFLRWNFNPARIFMGDSGALFIGFIMAMLAIKLEFPALPESQSWMIPVLILGVPLFDATLVSLSRFRRRLNPLTSPGKDHTSHRLANLGLGQRGAVLVLYTVAALLGGLAVFATRLPLRESYLLLAVVVLSGLAALLALEQAPYQRQERRRPAPVERAQGDPIF